MTRIDGGVHDLKDQGARMHVSVLGPIGVAADGQAIDLSPRLARLLAVLVVNNGSVVSTDRLIDAVWDGDEPERAMNSLRVGITRLRSALGDPERIVHQSPGYVLRLHDGELDRDTFLSELDEARRAVHVGEFETADGVLERALDRWSGSPLGKFGDEEWARPESARLTERRVEARELKVEVLLATGRADQAVAQARAIIGTEPLRERPRELLMTALYRSGRQAEALREYRAFVDYLADETGLEPSASISKLEARILRNEVPTGPHVAASQGYELGERIGEGAFSVVHRAIQPGVERDVAVKIIRAELADRPEFVRRFEVEARTVARLEHPHVVPLYDYWREPGAAYLVMRLMRGGSVEQALRTRGAYSRDDIVHLLADIGPALTAAHRAGVVHRDVRPANLLLDADGGTYLADFGIAVPTATAVDDPVANPAYAAPELLRGEPAGAAADVLSVGVTVFELLTGRLPFAESDDRAELVRRQLNDPLPPVRATRPDLPQGVDVVLAKATAKAAGDRHDTVAGFVADITDAIAGRTTTRIPDRADAPSNPYVGLHAFDEADADRFFGRETLIAELANALEQHPMITVVGPSGSGKSSVVRAGLIPALRHGAVPGSDQWFITTMLPGRDPIAAFETALLRVAVNPPDSLRRQLADDGGLLRAVRRVMPDDSTQLLVVIDQFEELFTQTTDDRLRDRFFDELAAAVTAPESPLRIVATVRGDHYDAPLGHPSIAELVNEATVAVRPLTPDQLERVIVGPAARERVDVEPALAAQLIAEVAEHPAALPLLQFSLTELFKRRISNVMLLSTHHDLGGLTGALAARADRLIDDGEPNNKVEARRVFQRLVTLGEGAEDTRRRARVTELGDGSRTAGLIDAFIKARLLVTDHDPTTREPTIEVAHEALLRDWPRLRRWIDEDRADLRTLHQISTATSSWEASGHDDGDLVRGARLATATELLDRHPDWLSPTETDWINRSRSAAEAAEAERAAAAERDRRQNRNLRRALVGAGCLLAIALLAASLALVARNRAADNERAAEAATAEAESATAEADVERLAALSGAQIDTQRDVAILLALEAVRRRPDATTYTALHRAISADGRLTGIHPPILDGSSAVALGSSGRVGVSWSQDLDTRRFQFVDMPSGDPISDPIATETGILVAAVAGDGSVAAVVTDDRTITLYTPDGDSTPLPAEVAFHIARDPWVKISHDGSRTAWNEFQQAAHVYDDSTGGIVFSVRSDGEWPFIGPVSISPDGTRVAVGRSAIRIDGPGGLPRDSLSRLEVYDVATGDLVAQSEPIEMSPHSIAIDDRGTVMAGYREGAAALWSTGDGTSPRLLPSHHGFVSVVGISPGGIAVSVSDDRTAQHWSLDGLPIGEPIGVQGEVNQVAFTDDGTVILAQLDGTNLEVDPDASVLITDTISVDGWAALHPGLAYYETFPDDLTGYTIRALDDDSIVHEVDLTDEYPFGIDPRASWSRNGEWAFRSGLDDQGRIIGGTTTNVDGSIRKVLAPDPVVRLAGGAVRDIRGGWTVPNNKGDRLLAIVTLSGESRVGWFDANTGELIAGPMATRAFTSETNGPVLFDDGTTVMGDRSGSLTILPPDLTGEPIEVPGGFNAIDVDEVGRRVLVGSGDGDIGLVDVDTGTLEIIGTSDKYPFRGAISPDGRRAVLLLHGLGAQLVDLDEQAILGVSVFDNEFGSVGGMHWSDDGTTFWMNTTDRGIFEVSADPEQWVDIACDIVHRELTVEEWHRSVDPDSEPVPACDR